MSIKLIVTHAVKDFAHWKSGFDAHGGARDAAGFKQVFLAQDVNDANSVTVCMDVPSVEAAQAFLSSPDLQRAMAEGGVVGEPQIRILKSV